MLVLRSCNKYVKYNDKYKDIILFININLIN